MKSILVPTEQHALLPSTLQSALLLARKFDSYVEGFALFPAMVELYALDSGVPLPDRGDRDHDAEMAKQTRDALREIHDQEWRGEDQRQTADCRSAGWIPRRTAILSSAATAACSISSSRVGRRFSRWFAAEPDDDRSRRCSKPAVRC